MKDFNVVLKNRQYRIISRKENNIEKFYPQFKSYLIFWKFFSLRNKIQSFDNIDRTLDFLEKISYTNICKHLKKFNKKDFEI